MIVTIAIEDSISSITLPEKVNGQYWLYNTSANNLDRLISIEGINGEWILKSNKEATIVDQSGTAIRSAVLGKLNIYHIRMRRHRNNATLFTESNTDDRQLYTKYSVDGDIDLTIGRSEQNSILLDNPFVSGMHARLIFKNEQWSIIDNNSSNGTFVNGVRVTSGNLAVGDQIFIMGLKIIVGSRFLALNNPDGSTLIQTNRLKRMLPQQVQQVDEEEELEAPELDYFYRSPRFKRDVETAVFRIDSPPPNAIGEEMPLMLSIGPSVTMGMASMATALFAINNAMASGDISRAMPSIVMSASMLLGSIMWPIISKKYDQRRRRKKEKLRQHKYKEYLNKFKLQFEAEAAKQEEILRENHVTAAECIVRIENVQRNLWERGFGQNDFLQLKAGTGSGVMASEIMYSEKRFTIDDDNLQEELYALAESPTLLRNIPITLSLFEDHITGVIGDRQQAVEFAKGLIFQLAALYSYDEVKLVFIYDQDEEHVFNFVKWLPHVWDNAYQFRFIATSGSEVKAVSSYLEQEIEARARMSENALEDIKPYYVLFALSKQLAVRAEMLKEIYAKKKNLHMSIVCFYDELRNLPKECTMVVELEDNVGKLYDKNDLTGRFVSFVPDIQVKTDPRALSVKLANVPLDTQANSFKLPQMVTFLEMYGVGKVEHLNALTRWRDNDPTTSLEAAIGVDALGELFKLDLHERFHGPHGLIAGMTGSGKSELIIAFILSLAVNYHPREVAFILIDYKGGGMAKSFEKLPHTAGIITNLDGAAIKRSLVSIESELKRRQAIFAEVSKRVGESNIDIYKYQKMYREGVVQEPLQHLFIISDEFAELKTQQPAFMAKLISAARIGRSLGIHLILATQKPSGIVDDQIWSNSKFRISLKVQERSDSMDMLKRPDAAELKETGRFYLQVGYNELFEMGQSAWAGAPYYPSDKVVVEKDSSVVVIDRNGIPLKQAKLDRRSNLLISPKKQMDVVIDYLCSIAVEEQIFIRPLWLEAIPAMILLDETRRKYGVEDQRSMVLNPVVGEYDDPANQQQCLLRLPITEEGNTILYGAAGTGKTTFLNTMIYSLLHEHSPEEVNLYLLDFASETLRGFAKAPHVGDVVLAHENEKVGNLFRMLRSELDSRKKRFADFGGDHASYTAASSEKLPSIVVVVNNFAAFTEMYEEKEEAVSFLSREGTRYGIYFVLTSLGTNGIRFRLLQNFKQLLVLQLNDENDYSTVVGKTDGLYPSSFKGRGLVKKQSVYEFQTAHITDEPVPFSYIQQACLKLRESWKGHSARKIPILPNHVDAAFLNEYVDENDRLRLPVGVESSSLNVHYYPFDQAYIHMALSTDDQYKGFVQELTILMAQVRLDVTVLDAGQGLRELDHAGVAYRSSGRDLEELVSAMFDLVVYRHNTYKDAMERGEAVEAFEQKVFVINSLAALKNGLSAQGAEKLGLILEKGEANYKLTVILAEQSRNLSAMTFDKWYKRHIHTGDGIWVGSGIAEQYQLKPSKTTSDMRDELTNQFGFSLQKGRAVKLKLLNSRKEDEDDAE